MTDWWLYLLSDSQWRRKTLTLTTSYQNVFARNPMRAALWIPGSNETANGQVYLWLGDAPPAGAAMWIQSITNGNSIITYQDIGDLIYEPVWVMNTVVGQVGWTGTEVEMNVEKYQQMMAYYDRLIKGMGT